MRGTRAPLLILLWALPALALAQSASPYVRTLARSVPMDIYEVVNYTLQCPPGSVPTSYSITPQYPYDANEDQGRTLVDRTGAPINRATIASAAQLDGAGYSLQVFNTEHHAKILEALATCLSTSASTDNTFQIVKNTGNAAKQTTIALTAFCPGDSPVAFGGFSNSDGRTLEDAGSSPVWGTSASPILLADVPDGVMGPPTGWQMQVFNNISANPAVVMYAICGKAPTLQTTITSIATAAAKPYTVFGPVPEGWSLIGTGFDGGTYGLYSGYNAWVQDGTIINAIQWYESSSFYDSGPASVRALMMAGIDGRLKSAPVLPKASARATLAVLAVPQASTPPPPTTVTVVEYYDAGLDHYFITPIADEIAKLDNGTFKGWTRTGQTFNAYGIGSAGRTGRRPVCREYGRPEAGLDSHFYSASPDECMASLANTLGAWGLEASELFQMDLPDPATGACPSGGIPVYRIWNQRRDSNHRYTTNPAIRDQMVTKGGVAEGYGPSAVALCALP